MADDFRRVTSHVDAQRVLTVGRFGLADEHAEVMLQTGGWWNGEGVTAGSQSLLTALSRAPDPDLALRGLDRLREGLGTHWSALADALRHDVGLRGRLLSVLGLSSVLADHVVAHRDQWQKLCSTTMDSISPLATFVGLPSTQSIRLAHRESLLQIAAADLGHVVEPAIAQPSYEHVIHQLTNLADITFRAAFTAAKVAVDASNCRLAVIAMGKCGARELNYVSDVDVVFVAEGDLSQATRLAAVTMRIASEAGYEVDASLRPEGKFGALVRTIEGYATYYQRWAKTWEFQALLKSRPIAGDESLGQSYMEVIAPLAWTAANREDFVADVRSMRRRVEQHVPAELVDRELKLGHGGLRDIEFAVQLLQLVHGRSDESLRCSGTVEALDALGCGGYVGRKDAAELSESYRFLRLLEHRLQLRKLRRTHLFPAEQDHDELRLLARASGIQLNKERDASQVLLTEFRQHTHRVRRLHEKLFYRPLLEAVARVPAEGLRLTTAQAIERLTALGYVASDGALHHIEALISGVSRRAAIQRALLPVLLELLADMPDPDGGLLGYRRLSEALAETPWYLRLLRDEGAVLQRLATVLGTAKLVPDLLIRAPEVLRLYADIDELGHRDPAKMAASLKAAVSRHKDLAVAVTAARSFRRHELVRVASADVLGLLDVQMVCGALSQVWAAVLRAALDAVLHASPAADSPARLAVIAMGRLGGAELGYVSDADVLFVCSPHHGYSEADAVRWASLQVETLRRVLSAPSQDPPLHVDVELRPEGRQGPLVRTLESYRAYYARWGETWEAQALLRARPIAGDIALGQEFINLIDPLRYPENGLSSTHIREIRQIKARVETERLPRGADPNTHTKLGRGGLADVEWAVQLLQLRHAYQLSALRTPSTLDALIAAETADLITPKDAKILRTAWLLATKTRNAIMLVRGKPSDQLPTTPRDLVAVANIVTDHPATESGEFLDTYHRATRQARAVVERIFYES